LSDRRQAKGLMRRDLQTIDATRRVGGWCSTVYRRNCCRAATTPRCSPTCSTWGACCSRPTRWVRANMLGQAVAYSLTREQFNRPIGCFRHTCAPRWPPASSVNAGGYAAHAVDSIRTKRACGVSCEAHVASGQVRRQDRNRSARRNGLHRPARPAHWFKRVGLNRQLLGSPERLRDEAARAQALIV
jgi:hypothetical protein